MRLKITEISKPIEPDYKEQQAKYEKWVASLPPAEQDRIRRRDAEAVAKEEAERKAKIADKEPRWQAWLKQHGQEGIEDRAADADTSDEIHGVLFELSARFYTQETVNELRAEGKTVAAVTPCWSQPFTRWLIDGNAYPYQGPFTKRKSAARIRLPLAIGDDSITLTLESQKCKWDFAGESIYTRLEDVSPFSGKVDGVFIKGRLVEDHACEMTGYRVEIDAPEQAIADKLAAYFDKLFADINLPDDLSVILAPSDRCFNCGRPLDDPISKALWIGPTCAKTLGAPHNAEAARIVTEKRRQFSCSAVDDALAEMLS